MVAVSKHTQYLARNLQHTQQDKKPAVTFLCARVVIIEPLRADEFDHQHLLLLQYEVFLCQLISNSSVSRPPQIIVTGSTPRLGITSDHS